MADGAGRGPAVAKALAGAAVAVATVAAGTAIERFLVRRARSIPDPSQDEPLAERPRTERRIASFDGTVLAVAEAGPRHAPAPTLVFVHGFSLDLTTWHYQWTRLASRHRCVLYDARGHGLSARAATGDYSMESLGRDLKAVLDAVCPAASGESVVLVGHSMGGMAVLSLASLYPEEFGGRVIGVVLADTTAQATLEEGLGGVLARVEAIVRPSIRRQTEVRSRAERLRSMAEARRADVGFLIARATNFHPGTPASVVDHVVRASLAADVEVWPKLLPTLVGLDLRPALANVRVPAVVIAGQDDRITPVRLAQRVAGELPDGRLVVLPGAGHVAMLERPDELRTCCAPGDSPAPLVQPYTAAGRPRARGAVPHGVV